MTDTSITADRPFLQHPYSSLVHFSLNPLKAGQTLRMTADAEGSLSLLGGGFVFWRAVAAQQLGQVLGEC
jgi:hypothetical protein